MAVEEDIFNAFVAKVYDNRASLDLAANRIALPGMTFTEPTPEGDEMYVRLYHLPSGPPITGVGFATTKTHYGLFQVSIFQAKGSGEMKARRLGSALLSLFKQGTVLTKNSTKVQVLVPPYLLPVPPEDKWTHLPVRVQYSCYALNPA